MSPHRAPSAAPRRRWWAPRRPATTRLVATALLASGSALAGLLMVVLPGGDVPVAVPPAVPVVLVLLAVHALGCWLTPPDSPAGHVVLAAAALTGVLGLGCTWWALVDQLGAGATMLGIPMVYAASQFRRPAVVVTGLLVLGTAAVVMLLTPTPAPLVLLDWTLVSFGLVVLAVFVVHHAEGQEALLDRLQTLAGVDALTGLVTRRVLDEALTASLSSAGARSGTALIVLDVDRFKTVNDVHGHPAGDAALHHVAELVSAAVRGTDCVVSRLGGDELAVLLTGCPVEVAVRRGEEIVAAVRAAPLVLDNGTVLPLTVSLGVAHAPVHALDVRSLYTAADQALYAAKRAGRDRLATAG